jgi:hypothetical protein
MNINLLTGYQSGSRILLKMQKILNKNQKIKGMINKYMQQLLSDWGLSSHIHQSDGMSVG